MKNIILILSAVTGGFMLLDGIYVMIKGKYIGPEKPGPWAGLFYKMNVDVFKLGPLFILYGMVWLAFALGIWNQSSWSYMLGMLISILTFWYLPVGTFFSFIILVILLFFRNRLGI